MFNHSKSLHSSGLRDKCHAHVNQSLQSLHSCESVNKTGVMQLVLNRTKYLHFYKCVEWDECSTNSHCSLKVSSLFCKGVYTLGVQSLKVSSLWVCLWDECITLLGGEGKEFSNQSLASIFIVRVLGGECCASNTQSLMQSSYRVRGKRWPSW